MSNKKMLDMIAGYAMLFFSTLWFLTAYTWLFYGPEAGWEFVETVLSFTAYVCAAAVLLFVSAFLLVAYVVAYVVSKMAKEEDYIM